MTIKAIAADTPYSLAEKSYSAATEAPVAVSVPSPSNFCTSMPKNTEELRVWVAKFSHILNFQMALDRAGKKVNLSQIERIAENILQKALGAEELVQTLPGKIPDLYSADLKADPFSFATQVLKDLQRRSFVAIKKAGLGDNGPTLLGTFPNRSTATPIVIKCTSGTEFQANALYGILSAAISSPRGYLCSPKSSYLDLNEQIFTDLTLENHLLSPEQTTSITGHIKDIFRSAGVTNTSLDGIIFAEKVEGCTLLDYTQELYTKLSPHQKSSLFFQLGKLLLLDVLSRQLDRITKPTVNGDELDPQEQSNIGNLMIVHPKTEEDLPSIYLIDNDIQVSFLEIDKELPGNLNAFFLHFLDKMKADPRAQADELRDIAMSSLSRGFSDLSAYLSNAFEENQYAVEEASQKAQPFIEDLETYKETISDGIMEAYQMLQKTSVAIPLNLLSTPVGDMVYQRLLLLQKNN